MVWPIKASVSIYPKSKYVAFGPLPHTATMHQ